MYIGNIFLRVFATIIVLVSCVACADRTSNLDTGIGRGPTQSYGTNLEDQDISNLYGDLAGKIAFIGTDGNLFTVSPDGSNLLRLTSTNIMVGTMGHVLAKPYYGSTKYVWPTWSPDNRQIAVSRISNSSIGESYGLEIIDTKELHSTRVYDNPTGTIPIAKETPHYAYWAPDGNNLGLLTSSGTSLSLLIINVESGSNPTFILDNRLAYFYWGGNSERLIVHSGLDLLLMRLIKGSTQVTTNIEVSPDFRAPALSMDGTRVFYILQDGNTNRLFSKDVRYEDRSAEKIMEVGEFSALVRSPATDAIAVSDSVSFGAGSFGRLTIIEEDNSIEELVLNEQILAFFWSPDGTKIAYITSDNGDKDFNLRCINLIDGLTLDLAIFSPSNPFQTLVGFFDQYTHSHSIWSPDSSNLIFSGNMGDRSTNNGDSSFDDKLYVIAAKKDAKPRQIAASSFGTWSWD